MSEPIIIEDGKRYKFKLRRYEDDYIVGCNTDYKICHIWSYDHGRYLDIDFYHESEYLIASIVDIGYSAFSDYIIINVSDVDYP